MAGEMSDNATAYGTGLEELKGGGAHEREDLLLTEHVLEHVSLNLKI